MTLPAQAPLIYLIATEESGDRLGAPLMRELRERLQGNVRFAGIGGSHMQAEGLTSLFPISELSIIGFSAVLQKLPMILQLLKQATNDVLSANPAMLIIIDSPDFTQRVAKRVHARNSSIPIINYVSPTVWAWRPGRARKMRVYVDHVLALLPFEPAAHQKLGGPPCTYVGHPLIEQLPTLRPSQDEQLRREANPPVLLVLPGSRRSEIRHHMQVFGETLAQLQASGVAFEPVLATMPHLEQTVIAGLASWTVKPRVVIGEAAKREAFRIARAALAKSGTVTLELALSGVPMVTAYRGGAVEAWIAKKVVRTPSVILANIVIGENVVPEYLQDDCTVENLLPVLRDVILDTPQRARQVAAFARLDDIMGTGEKSPSELSADIILKSLRR